MLTWFFLLLFLAVAITAGGLAARSYMTGEPIAGIFFKQRPEKRLSVVEQASVDNRRRLLLIKRDGVEHLIMTGGPVDIVIETGIAPSSASNTVRVAAKTESDGTVTTSFGRQPRTLGQVVNE